MVLDAPFADRLEEGFDSEIDDGIEAGVDHIKFNAFDIELAGIEHGGDEFFKLGSGAVDVAGDFAGLFAVEGVVFVHGREDIGIPFDLGEGGA